MFEKSGFDLLKRSNLECSRDKIHKLLFGKPFCRIFNPERFFAYVFPASRLDYQLYHFLNIAWNYHEFACKFSQFPWLIRFENIIIFERLIKSSGKVPRSRVSFLTLILPYQRFNNNNLYGLFYPPIYIITRCYKLDI